MLGVVKVLPFLAFVGAVPLVQEAAFIGEGTNELASALLEGHLSRNENLVFSPLGYNTLLAIFAEGARGPTRDEIANALHFPSDPQAVRLAYQSILKRLSVRNQPNSPEMRNWFYIYKNHTVDTDLKEILKNYYLTEVKSVDRPQEFLELQSKVKVPSGLQGKPTDHLIDVDKEVESIIDAASSPHKTDGEEASHTKKPAVLDDPEKKIPEVKDEVNAENLTNDSEKLPGSANTEEKDHLSTEEHLKIKNEEKEVAMEELKPVGEIKDDVIFPIDEKIPIVENTGDSKLTPAVMENTDSELTPAVLESTDSKLTPAVLENTDSKLTPALLENTDEKVTENEVKEEILESSATSNLPAEPVKEEKVEEMMIAMQRSLESLDDMSGMTDSAVKVKGKEPESQMIVFNGLYFRGGWNTQFVKRPADDSRPFYKANNEKVFVKTLHAEGLFQTADCPELNSRAIELQYEGGRYSLLLVIPKAADGLEKLTSDLSNFPISKIYKQLSEKLVDVCLPTFEVTTISHPVTASQKMGLANVKSIFNPETADLSGITAQPGLFVEELVQVVTFQVDSNFTEANFLSASLASSRSDLERFQVNQPFLFYLRDNVDDIIIVNGKIVDPTPPVDDYRSNLKKPLV